MCWNIDVNIWMTIQKRHFRKKDYIELREV